MKWNLERAGQLYAAYLETDEDSFLVRIFNKDRAEKWLLHNMNLNERKEVDEATVALRGYLGNVFFNNLEEAEVILLDQYRELRNAI